MPYTLFFTATFEKQLKKIKKKDQNLFERLKKAIVKIRDNPEIGKPLKHDLKGTRRIHLNPFVLVYSVEGEVISLHYSEHHDDAY